MPITLYYSPMSPPARAVILLIKELGLTVELKEVDVRAGATRTEEFLRMNPEHTIPTLDDNGFYLAESRAILTYLIDRYYPGHELYPNIPKEKALINRVLNHDLSVFSLKTLGELSAIYRGLTSEVSEEMKTSVSNALSNLELFLVRNDWIAGENVTVADLSLLPTIASMVHAGLDLSRHPRLLAWYDNCKVLKGYQDDQEIAQQFGTLFRSMVTKGF
ncbi:glutathione S-transferase D4-like [Topomyia yanbarensis]|uniref:glutathione S-transferase D4-like n=1 Tax=Topomyia yanbarensis TaxID=2498891 RepID=UPI00273CBD68|nr:glutathione S-transferase D4-like [Topomyia yanbarensis]